MFDVGDVVECIRTCHPGKVLQCSGCGCYPVGVTRGSHYRVHDIIPSEPLETHVGLILVGDVHWCYCSSMFRKLEKGVDIFSLVTKRKEPIKEREPELV